MSKSLFCFLFLILSIVHSNAKESCKLNLQSMAFRPFILKDNGDLHPMESDTVTLNSYQNATVTCQTYKFEKYPKLSSITVSCDNGKLLSESGKVVPINDLRCDLKIVDIFKCRVRSCPQNNTGACFAYFDKSKNSYVKVAETCHDSEKGRSRFIRVQVAKKLHSSGTPIADSDLTELYEKIDILKNMIRLDDENKLSALLDQERSSGDDLTLQKLLPEGIIGGQFRDAQKYPINNVGVWRSVSDGNWNNVIEDIKSYLSVRDDSSEVTFGTEKTLVSHGGDVMYSKGKREMIPQFLWASVKDVKAGSGVVVVVLNDAYASTKELKSLVFCKNVCDQISWLKYTLKHDNHKRPALGFTFCCFLDDFEKHLQ